MKNMGEIQRTKKIVKELSEIILRKMEENNLTSKEMAEKCGISKRKLDSVILREEKGMTVEVLMKICESIEIKLILECKK